CWLLALPIAIIEIALSLAGMGMIGGEQAVGWRIEAIQQVAITRPLFDWMVAQGHFSADLLARFVLYPFVHYGPVQAIFVVVFILAIGKFVSEVFRPWAVILLFFASAILGGVAYGALSTNNVPLFGGYPPVYGLIGGLSFILWTRLGGRASNRLGAFTLIGFLLGFQFLFSVFISGAQEWIADLAGFLTGFFLSFVVAPGGIRRAVERIRQR
ncbi:rhomboid family intramembrane serine protease, partial [Thioclava sp. BHET1]